MNVADLFPTRFIAAADLNGKSFTLTIRSVTLEDMQTHDNQKTTKPCLWFENAQRGMVLNKTNSMTIANLYSYETDDWVGKQITIYATKVRAFGKMEDAIRVREIAPSTAPAARASGLGGGNEASKLAQQAADSEVPPAPKPAAPAAPSGPADAAQDADASMWDSAGTSSKSPDDITPAQLLRLIKLMAQLYGPDWGQLEPKLAADASKGSVRQFSDLTVREATVLLGKLDAGIAQAQAQNGKVA